MLWALLQPQFSPRVRKKDNDITPPSLPKENNPTTVFCWWHLLPVRACVSGRFMKGHPEHLKGDDEVVKVQRSFSLSSQSRAEHLGKRSVIQGTQEPVMMISGWSTTSIVNYCLAEQRR